MNGNSPQKRSYALSPDRNIALILELLLIVAGGALAGKSCCVKCVFDNVAIDRKGKLRPGRFVMAEIFYRL